MAEGTGAAGQRDCGVRCCAGCHAPVPRFQLATGTPAHPVGRPAVPATTGIGAACGCCSAVDSAQLGTGSGSYHRRCQGLGDRALHCHRRRGNRFHHPVPGVPRNTRRDRCVRGRDDRGPVCPWDSLGAGTGPCGCHPRAEVCLFLHRRPGIHSHSVSEAAGTQSTEQPPGFIRRHQGCIAF